MTRNGKIARLPRYLREKLNRRLNDGEPGPQVLAWLNECAAVREVVERDFGGRPINEQNLSDWRQGGFRDWQRQQEACDHVRRLTDQSEALDEATEDSKVSDRLATVFAVELYKLLEQLLEKGADDKEKLGYLREGLREIRLLRRGDHNAARVQLEWERWERQCEREHEAELGQKEEKFKKHSIGMLFSALHEGAMARALGGGETARAFAEMLTKLKYDLPLDDLPEPDEAAKAGNGASAPGRNGASHGKAETATTASTAEPNQGKSR